VPEEQADLILRRAFHWGALFVGDADADFETDLRERSGIRAGRFHAWIPVRHAQDVDLAEGLPDDTPIPPFEVTVACHLLPAATLPTSVEVTLDVPSGRISLGDADDEAVLDVAPGSWTVQIVLEPADHAERVELRLSPAQLTVERSW
jgi:hypothetical protein